MPGVTRLGDISTGCACCGPVPAVMGYGTVLTNGRPTVTVGMYWNSHGCSECSHPIFTIVGNPTVLVGGKPIVTQGCVLSDGGVVALGSGNVMA